MCGTPRIQGGDVGRPEVVVQAQDQPCGGAAPDPEVPRPGVYPPGVDPEEEEPPPAPEPVPPALLDALALAMADRPAPSADSAPHSELDDAPIAIRRRLSNAQESPEKRRRYQDAPIAAGQLPALTAPGTAMV